MTKDVKISASATIDTKIVTKFARAAVTLATDNKYSRTIPFHAFLRYNQSITI